MRETVVSCLNPPNMTSTRSKWALKWKKKRSNYVTTACKQDSLICWHCCDKTTNLTSLMHSIVLHQGDVFSFRKNELSQHCVQFIRHLLHPLTPERSYLSHTTTLVLPSLRVTLWARWSTNPSISSSEHPGKRCWHGDNYAISHRISTFLLYVLSAKNARYWLQ